MKKLIFLFTVLIFSACSLYAQNKTIKGSVIDNLQLEPLSFVAIMIDDTVGVGSTDLNGFFLIDIPIYVNKLLLGLLDWNQQLLSLKINVMT